MIVDETNLPPSQIDSLMERGFFIQDGFLGEPLAAEAADQIDRLFAAGQMRAGRLSRGRHQRFDPQVRSDLITWLDPLTTSPPWHQVRERFDGLRIGLNRTLYLGLNDLEIQLACYPGGGARYARHLDTFRGSTNRRITAICYLNPGWEPHDGGLLRLYLSDGQLDVEPRLDRLLVFLSDAVEHEVLPTLAVRRTVTVWFRQRSLLPVSA